MTLKIIADVATTFSLAAQHNSYPLIKKILISAPYDEDGDHDVAPERQTLRNIRVRLTTEPEFIAPEEWLVDQIDVGQSAKLQDKPLKPHHKFLADLTEQVSIKLKLVASFDGLDGINAETESHHEIQVLPADFWGGERRQPELLAAFVQPNTHIVDTLCAKVTHLLRKENLGSGVDGYKSNTRERPYLFGSALWSVLFNERLTYLSPPQSWAEQGQRIRLGADIMQYKTAACLDTSVLFASCLENMGLNPVIALTKDHAFAGFWLIDECFPVLTNDDPIELRKRIDSADLVMFETTLVTNDSPIIFKQAIERAKDLLAEEKESDFVMLIDIRHARSRRIRPLSLVETGNTEASTGGDDGLTIGLGNPPVLPPVRAEERVIEETPETRVDAWQRKLLDLTKRNPLLNVKSSALKLFCPDLGELEDKLAAGDAFGFMAAEDTGLDDPNRSSESFLLATGNDLHRDFALQQLSNKKIVVNDTKKRMETKLVELLRKAKNDLEEGGSNTLYVSIGMLRWKETPEADKSYRAPLILLPVRLERRSAQAPVYIRQLPDEEPIFNLTLIEMLQTDYDINLDQLRHDLPEDESGVDVEGIWNIVREAIKEQQGFIVVEEIVLGSFSFAKYLMWKDLRDRTDLLKRSPFVEHLVDRPSDTYQQESSFISSDEVDQKISPAEFFAPLNCDSSQTVAVAASAEPQDFVLEGPPGTGKSETIANIISHNLALGRKVLFVAEKMAALQVVFRRMEKVGLSHLCLELHSNKANKKSVLDQLAAAWSKRETASQSDWIKRARELETLRDHLNRYVEELHYRHPIGISPREAMARVVRYQYQHPVRLDWPEKLHQAPIKLKADIDPLLETAKEMGIAFEQIADLDPDNFKAIKQTDWSNQWRMATVELANKIAVSANQAQMLVKTLLDTLGIAHERVTLAQLRTLAGLHTLCEIAAKGNVDFALNSGGAGKLAALEHIAQLQTQLFDTVRIFGHGLKWNMLNELELEDWIKRRDEATGLFGFIKRHSLRKMMRSKGLSNIADLSTLEKAVEARDLLDALNTASQPLLGTDAWAGVDTDPNRIQISLNEGAEALKLFTNLVATLPDPTIAAPALRRHLVEGRDFLTDGSQLVSQAHQVAEAYRALEELLKDASAQRIEITMDEVLTDISADFAAISDNNQKLNRWCRWLAMKKRAEIQQISVLSSALETHSILAQDAEANLFTALCYWLAPILIDNSETLRQFAGASHEATIEKFKELDATVASTAAEYIIARTAGAVPDQTSKSTTAEYGVLARELQKKTRHKPVRALVTEMGASLTNLTPCFMMSPLSVAQFLPADFALFDLVVFDEASQITTWDAVGAIARGNNVIVVGDPKQMPPSNNFGRVDVDETDEGDMESILDQALAARLPHLRLTGHYRSRHETLIAFSNSHYYGNQLTTFPSADTKESAVTLYRIDGVYAKGRGQTNPIEAKAVVDEVVRRLQGMLAGDPKMSIGIVTINSQQQRIVEDLMDEARRRHPEIEAFFIATDDFDPPFVKNLESVQGDERDIIVLSLTYGPTDQGGKTMSMNFGPLNKQGGERRLNVAVTRATSEVLVFASFDSSMIDLSRTQATAVEHLKNYLEFAERGPIALAEFSSATYGVDQFDSDFEHAVALSLRDKGWKVQTQVGVSKFRVDLGIVHPDQPGKYLAGVECDGATYHGSPSARDRDRVRQVILENLGWRIVRLWSTDYFQDPEHAMTQLHESLEAILESDRASRSEREASKEEERQADPKPETDEVEVIGEPEEIAAYMSKSKETSSVDLSSKEAPLSLAKGVLEGLPAYDKELYFKDTHRITLSHLAQSILELKNGITLHELMLDVAHLHGLSRTSKKQREHLHSVIKDWAGFWRQGEENTTVWRSPADVCSVIPWRGYLAFGVERDWAGLCYQEQIGVAKAAILANPEDPVDWMFREFAITRRHSATEEIFASWVARVKAGIH